MQDISVRELAKDSEFSGVSLVTLERWCAEDRWVEQRTKFFAQMKESMESKLGNRLVSERVKTLANLDDLMNNALGKLSSNIVDANSFEGLMSATIRVAEFREKLLDKILAGIGDVKIGEDGEFRDPVRSKPALTIDEVRDMARVVLERRRALKRGEKEETKKPKLRVLREPVKSG